MIRRVHSSRCTLLLAILGLIASSLAIVPAASAAETPPGDLFVVASDEGNAGVGGQWWTADGSITVDVFDGDALQATVTTDTPPDPGSNYWWGVHTGIAIYPGWTVTATGDNSGHSVTTVVSDVVVEGWDEECTVYGTTTYDPTNLRVDVYDPVNLERYVTWTTDSSEPAVYSWTADFCQAPGPRDSGDAVNNDLVAPSGQAIHHDGGLGATMYHFASPTPRLLLELPLRAWWDGSNWVDGYWLEGDSGWPVGETVDISVNDVPQGSTTVVDPSMNPNEFFLVLSPGLDLGVGDEISASVASGGPSAKLSVTSLAISSVNVDTEVVTGTADPGSGPFEVGIGAEAVVLGSFVADSSGVWTVDLDTIDSSIDIQIGQDVYARMDDGSGNFVQYWFYIPAPRMSVNVDSNFIFGYDWEPETDVSVTLRRGTETWNWTSGIIEWHRGFGIDAGFDILPNDVVTMQQGTTTKSHTVVDISVVPIDVALGQVEASYDSLLVHMDAQGWGQDDTHAYRSIPGEDMSTAPGSYPIDFTAEPPEGQGNGTITTPLAGALIEMFDAELDSTMAYFGQIPETFTGGEGGGGSWFSVDAGVGTPASASGDGVWGEQWLANSAVTVTFDNDDDPLNGVLHEFGDATDSEGRFGAYWDTGYFQTFDLKPGQYVTVTDGATTKDTRVTALRVDNVDFDTELVTGTADPLGDVNLGLFEGYDCTDSDIESPQCWRKATADSDGAWSVDFSTDPSNDLHPAGSMLVFEGDDDGDGTQTPYGPLEPGPELRQIEVYREFNVVLAWESEHALSLTVTRSGVEVYSSTAFYGFDLWQDEFELEVNDLVAVTDGDTTKEHVVRGQTVNGLLIDPDFPNRVTGTALPNTDVNIRYNTIRSELSDDNIENTTVSADAFGDWSYEFVTAVVAGTAVEVTQRDAP